MDETDISILRKFTVDGRTYGYSSLPALEAKGFGEISRLPLTIRILLENLLRHDDGRRVTRTDIERTAGWRPNDAERGEVPFFPHRILTHDSLGLGLFQDLAMMRDALAARGGDPADVNPKIPVDLIVDHAVIAESTGRPDSLAINTRLELERNRERFGFLKWAGLAFDNVRILPPGNGICHQVNLEYLASVVYANQIGQIPLVGLDTCLGTDSHTPMINGLGVLGWGVGAIEAMAAMLGEPVSVILPDVIGVRLEGRLPPGATVTDLVLSLTERLRTHGVVGRHVEFFGPGIAALTVPDRATIANMAPEYGSTAALFPIDSETTKFLRLTGRDEHAVQLVEAYARAQGLWHDPAAPDPRFTETVRFSLESIEPVLAGPSRPDQRVRLRDVPESLADAIGAGPAAAGDSRIEGIVVIAAITSCTNTSNPAAIIAAGLLARNAVARGLTAKPWVKTSLAPGSPTVAAYLRDAGLQEPLDALGFNVAAFGCTTCVGNSGPLLDAATKALESSGALAVAVLSGNRNFSGRVHLQTAANYLASPPLVIAYAIAGTVGIDLTREPLGYDTDGQSVSLAELWPSDSEIAEAVNAFVTPETYRTSLAKLDGGRNGWDDLAVAEGACYPWDPTSTMLRQPPYLDDLRAKPDPVADILGARPLAILGDAINTDQISPAGIIPPDSPAGHYLQQQGVTASSLYTYPMRRGDAAVVARASFAHSRLCNRMVDEPGGFTRLQPEGTVVPIFDAAASYRAEDTPIIVVAGRDYGAGSSRDSAAKGPALIGVRAIIAKSFERIHRANLVCMGILPLMFPEEADAGSLGLDGSERFDLLGLSAIDEKHREVRCRILRADESEERLVLSSCVESASEALYFRNGGVLPYLLRRMCDEL